mmetsp:Transcript_28443/g.80066  ORF Transcript_28443/g.80066 Transcript_28443/m.80066 type:complete len:261 (-) Transcript_28443:699-1481(-)
MFLWIARRMVCISHGDMSLPSPNVTWSAIFLRSSPYHTTENAVTLKACHSNLHCFVRRNAANSSAGKDVGWKTCAWLNHTGCLLCGWSWKASDTYSLTNLSLLRPSHLMLSFSSSAIFSTSALSLVPNTSGQPCMAATSCVQRAPRLLCVRVYLSFFVSSFSNSLGDDDLMSWYTLRKSASAVSPPAVLGAWSALKKSCFGGDGRKLISMCCAMGKYDGASAAEKMNLVSVWTSRGEVPRYWLLRFGWYDWIAASMSLDV